MKSFCRGVISVSAGLVVGIVLMETKLPSGIGTIAAGVVSFFGFDLVIGQRMVMCDVNNNHSGSYPVHLPWRVSE